MKIVVLDGYAANPGDLSWDAFTSQGELTVYDATPQPEALARIGDAEAVFTNKVILDREIISQAPKLRFIGVIATGYNVVDVQAARERGIDVCNVPAYSTQSVAQFTFALLLELCHHVGSHSDAVHAGRWVRSDCFTFWDTPLIELAGKTMGIVGYGSIGRAVAGIARAMGMDVIAYTRTPREPECVSFEALLERSDVISLHCPLFPETKGIINRESIARMKDGVLLLNTARGPLIVEQDLRDALDSGKVAGAGLDVLCREPMVPDCPLLGAPNCVITPHFAWAPIEARRRLMNVCAENLRAFIAGRPQNVVNA